MGFNASLFHGIEVEGSGRDSTSVRHNEKSYLYLSLALAHILIALWSCSANVTQVVNLVLDQNSRRQPRNVLIVNISISELLVASFLCPVYTDSLIRGPWRHGLLLCSAYEVVFYLQVCVSLMAVMMLNLERFYFLVSPPNILQQPAAKRHVGTAVLALLPWLVSLAVLVPIFTAGTRVTLEHVSGLHHHTCIVQWDGTLHMVTLFIAFLAPSFLLLATVVAVLVLYVTSAARNRDVEEHTSLPTRNSADHQREELESWAREERPSGRCRFPRLQEVDAKTKRECVTAVCASSFLSVGLQSPFFALLFLQQFCQQQYPPKAASEWSAIALLPESHSRSSSTTDSCQFSDTAWIVCMMLGMAKSAVLPLVWLLYKDIRAVLSPKACIRSYCTFFAARWSRSARSRRRQFDQTESACPSLPSFGSQLTVT